MESERVLNDGNRTAVTQVSLGRFHHFHLGRQLERFGMLDALFTGYPRFKLRDESGIPPEKIRTFPWVHSFNMAKGRIGLGDWAWLDREVAWLAKETLDKHVARLLRAPTHLVALSGSGLNAGVQAQKNGGKYICDRGSSHIRFQNQILLEEYKRFGIDFGGIDSRVIEKEELEYELADIVTVPSEFARRSFISLGVPERKIVKIPYGANLDRFTPIRKNRKETFTVLFVGAVTIQKGIIDLIDGFHRLSHPNKRLIVVGQMSSEVKSLILVKNLDNIYFKGHIKNTSLSTIYNDADVFVLPSLQEGLAMVMGEAMACGCPVIASENTGAEDLFTDGNEGFIIPVRQPQLIAEKLQQLVDDPVLRRSMSEAALTKVKGLGGWNEYGHRFVQLLRSF